MILNAHGATAAKARAKGTAPMATARRSQTFDEALASLERLQTDDFAGLFRAMDGLPVVIRLIDPPLHEFLPSHEELIAETTRLRTLIELEGGAGLVDAVGDRVTPALEKGLTKIFGKKDAARAMKLIQREGKAEAAASGGDRSALEARARGEGGAAPRRGGDARAEPDARPARRPARAHGP